MKRSCTICARGGSKGVLNKNVRMINEKPLIALTIIQAQKSKMFDKIAVSSDSEEILRIAKDFGVDIIIKRPDELATDTAAKIPVIRHAFIEMEKQAKMVFDTHVDLDCTSPLRNIEDIVNSIKLLEEKNVSNVLTAAHARRSPYFNLVELNEDEVVIQSKKLLKPIVRRQDAPKCFDMNASIYVWKRDTLLNSDSVFLHDTKLYVMPEERSLDIDSELDWEIVKFLASKRIDL